MSTAEPDPTATPNPSASGDPASGSSPTRVVFCWAGISGYMAACWRALLDRQPALDPYVVAFGSEDATAFSQQLMEGIPCRLLGPDNREDAGLIERVVAERNPDVLVLSGWFHRPYRRLAFSNRLSDARVIMGMDTPWQGTWKQHLARWALYRYLQRVDHVVVTGERCWQYARRLGMPPDAITRGLYGVDYDTLSEAGRERATSPWPRRFLFVGRVEAEKGVDVLLQAYEQYRSSVRDPWPLTCCGLGPMSDALDQAPGVDNRGFVQPADMPGVWREAGAFVLPSRFDPWPLALVEAASAHLPVVCSDACGSAVEVVRSGYSGLKVPTGSVDALAAALQRVHASHDRLPEWGRRAGQLAAPYSAKQWAERWYSLLTDARATGESSR